MWTRRHTRTSRSSTASRLSALVVVVGLLAVSCGGGAVQQETDAGGSPPAGSSGGSSDDSGGSGGRGGTPVVLEPIDSSAPEKVPSALDDVNDSELPEAVIDTDELKSGGPPPDGIPAIDEPKFVKPATVDWLAPNEPVIALELDSERRAYPVQVLIWHEIVNDTVGGMPVSVTYCPLCNTALAYDRRIDDRLVTFGTSGLLYKSALVMYDRQTESLWSQLESRAVAGELAGTELDRIPVQTITWSQWKSQSPDGYVLSRDTGHVRDYGTNPYTGYDNPDGDPFLFDGEVDPRLPPMTRVLGVGEGDDAAALELDKLADVGATHLTVDGTPAVAFAVPGLASALDAANVADGYATAATGVFDTRITGRQLTFEPTSDGQFRDLETQSIWTLTGQAVDGTLAGEQLRRVDHLDTFWFAWAAGEPETTIVDPEGGADR